MTANHSIDPAQFLSEHVADFRSRPLDALHVRGRRRLGVVGPRGNPLTPRRSRHTV